MEKTIVYWYHTKDQTDIMTEGYVGVTKHPEKRHRQHLEAMQNMSNLHLHNAMRKYKDNVLRDIVFEGSEQEAYELEYMCRPTNNIGWNMAYGGTMGVIPTVPVQLYHEDNYIKLYSFDSIAQASKELNISEDRISIARIRQNTRYGYDGWKVLLDPIEDRSQTESIRALLSRTAKASSTGRSSVFKGTTDRWSSEQKEAIGKHHKGKTISQEQRDIVRVKNRANHTRCRPIELKHISSPDIIHSFHSISEASRQLTIPLSRLKSKVQRSLNTYGNDGWAVHSYTNT